MNNVIVKSSTIAGRGIFASKDLKKGDTILIVDGPVIKYPFLPDWRVGMNHLHTEITLGISLTIPVLPIRVFLEKQKWWPCQKLKKDRK